MVYNFHFYGGDWSFTFGRSRGGFSFVGGRSRGGHGAGRWRPRGAGVGGLNRAQRIAVANQAARHTGGTIENQRLVRQRVMAVLAGRQPQLPPQSQPLTGSVASTPNGAPVVTAGVAPPSGASSALPASPSEQQTPIEMASASSDQAEASIAPSESAPRAADVNIPSESTDSAPPS